MAKKILLSERFGSNIFTRNTISAFFEDIKNMKEAEIKLDFSNVKFISRSCADEYIKQKEKTKKKIIEVSMAKNICSMFEAVKSQYKKAGFTISFDICNMNKKLISA
jgi:hypothetical protein